MQCLCNIYMLNMLYMLCKHYFSCLFRTAQKMKFSIKDSFSKCDQICSLLRIWSYLLDKSIEENFIFCAVFVCAVSYVCLVVVY